MHRGLARSAFSQSIELQSSLSRLHGQPCTRELIGAIIVATVLSLIFSSIAVYSLNRYLGPVDGSDSAAAVYVKR